MLDFSKELSDLYNELEEVQGMSDEVFAEKYEGIDREEFLEDLQSEINSLEPDEEEVEEYDEWDDHGFRDEADYNSWRYGNCLSW